MNIFHIKAELRGDRNPREAFAVAGDAADAILLVVERWQQYAADDGEAYPQIEAISCKRITAEVIMPENLKAAAICPHDLPPDECDACMVASDHAHDAAREARAFGR